jgi:hypothetical protein
MDLKQEIIQRQQDDPFIVEEVRCISEERQTEFNIGESGSSLWFHKRICVHDV